VDQVAGVTDRVLAQGLGQREHERSREPVVTADDGARPATLRGQRRRPGRDLLDEAATPFALAPRRSSWSATTGRFDDWRAGAEVPWGRPPIRPGLREP
jgi:hypothetical protein